MYEEFLKVRVIQLENAIKEHAAQRLDDRCFLDDLKLYKMVGINEHPGLALPKEQFLSNCAQYWKCQQTGEEYNAGYPLNEFVYPVMKVHKLVDNPYVHCVCSNLEAARKVTEQLNVYNNRPENYNKSLMRFEVGDPIKLIDNLPEGEYEV